MSSASAPVQQLAAFLAGLGPRDLPPTTRGAARLHVLDALAAQAAGWGSPLHRALLTWAGEATDDAALVGAALAHCHEADDIFDPALQCIGGLVVPATLALARERRAAGAEVLAAVVAGYEAMGRLGLALDGPRLLARGLWPTAVCGAFGVAAAAARLLQLPPPILADALALAAQQAGGLAGGADGLVGRNLLYGQTARAGLLAARAAAAGIAGPQSVFQGSRSLSNAFGLDWPAETLLARPLDGRFIVEDTAIKPYACARQLHASVECALAWRHEGGRLADVQAVTAHLPSSAAFLDRPGAAGLAAPAGSAQWAIAAALVHGALLPRQLDRDALQASPLADLASRVTVLPAGTGQPGPLAGGLTVVSKQGTRWHQARALPLGGPERPLSAREIEAKTVTLAEPALGGDAARLVRLVREIESLPSVDELGALLPPCRAEARP